MIHQPESCSLGNMDMGDDEIKSKTTKKLWTYVPSKNGGQRKPDLVFQSDYFSGDIR